MSAQSIRAYQERYGAATTVAEKLRVQAGDLRRRAAALLAQSNELEELADTAEAHALR